jgi:hypothetical protein
MTILNGQKLWKLAIYFFAGDVSFNKGIEACAKIMI